MAQKRKTPLVLAAAVSLIIVLLLIIAGCTQNSSNGNANTNPTGATGAVSAGSSAAVSTPYTIRANVNKDCSGTPWFVGVQKGFFPAGGINFIDSGALDWSLQPSALISGQTDVYDGHPNTLINLLKAGAHIHGVVEGGAEPPAGQVANYHMHWLVLISSEHDNQAKIFVQFGRVLFL